MSGVKWDYDPSNPPVYDGEEHIVTIDEDTLPDGVSIRKENDVPVYAQDSNDPSLTNRAVNAGHYVARPVFVYDETRYEDPANQASLEWQISPIGDLPPLEMKWVYYDISDPQHTRPIDCGEAQSFSYNNRPYSVYLVPKDTSHPLLNSDGSLPDYIVVAYPDDNNAGTNAGEYTTRATIQFSDESRENYAEGTLVYLEDRTGGHQRRRYPAVQPVYLRWSGTDAGLCRHAERLHP